MKALDQYATRDTATRLHSGHAPGERCTDMCETDRQLAARLSKGPVDFTRLHVAIAKLGNALGVKLDPKRPDHELVEQLAQSAEACLATLQAPGAALHTAWNEGWDARKRTELARAAGIGSDSRLKQNPYGRPAPHDAGSFACVCPACTRSGDA